MIAWLLAYLIWGIALLEDRKKMAKLEYRIKKLEQRDE